MRRETLVFTLAGVVFGFVLGYMAAGWDAMPRPAARALPAAGATASGPTPAPSQPAALDPNEASALESLAARQPGASAVRIELGNLYMDHQRWDDAIRWYREALALVPDDPDVSTDMGACYVHSGRPAEGLAEFDRVLQRNPGHRNARFNRGVALLELGRSLEAADAWDELLKRYPDDPQFQHLRGRIQEIRASAPTTGAGGTRGAGTAPAH
jgi:cytochrome c-type biogenesis protein CcmH/NrfG